MTVTVYPSVRKTFGEPPDFVITLRDEVNDTITVLHFTPEQAGQIIELWSAYFEPMSPGIVE